MLLLLRSCISHPYHSLSSTSDLVDSLSMMGTVSCTSVFFQYLLEVADALLNLIDVSPAVYHVLSQHVSATLHVFHTTWELRA